MKSGEQGTTPQAITEDLVARFADTPDARLRYLIQSLTRHLHEFAIETGLTQTEWAANIEYLTAVGQQCSPTRQDMILLSTVLGPFYVPESPTREVGSSIVEMERSGESAMVLGHGARH